MQKEESQVTVDEKMKTQWEEANDEKERTEALLEGSQRTLDSLSSTIEAGMKELEQLQEEFCRLSLSGSFSGPLEMAIKVLELDYESKGQQGVSRDKLEAIRASVEKMKTRLGVLNEAKEKGIVVTKAKEVLEAV